VPHRRRLRWICTLVAAALLSGDAAMSAGGGGDPAGPSRPRHEVLDLALRAYACGQAEGAVQRPVLAVIDYSLPSTQERLWLIDPRDGRVERSELVAHGRGSGDLRATRFSNTPGSYRSSLGLFVTGKTYTGRHGRSLRLYGLEPGVNDAAYERAIVIHPAWYATQAHAARFGRLGRSHGCPALAPDVAPPVLDALEDGAALFVYGDDPDWRGNDAYARCGPSVLRAHSTVGSADSSAHSSSSSP
jgi:hypothetical protein